MDAKTSSSKHKKQSGPATYTVDGKKFIVESVFKDKPGETLGEILLKLMKKDTEKP